MYWWADCDLEYYYPEYIEYITDTDEIVVFSGAAVDHLSTTTTNPLYNILHEPRNALVAERLSVIAPAQQQPETMSVSDLVQIYYEIILSDFIRIYDIVLSTCGEYVNCLKECGPLITISKYVCRNFFLIRQL